MHTNAFRRLTSIIENSPVFSIIFIFTSLVEPLVSTIARLRLMLKNSTGVCKSLALRKVNF